MKINILGILIDKITLSEAKSQIVDHILKKESFFVVTPNSEFIVEAQNNAEFKNTLNNADLAIPDGQGLIWASNILGNKPGITERVTGADLVEQLLVEAGRNGWKVGIVGARRGDIKEIQQLKQRLDLDFFELSEKWDKEHFDLILACHGMKKQEKWIVENMDKVKATVFMGIGGSLDFLSGYTRRAPLRIRMLGFEWLWRLIQKPSHIKRVIRVVEFGIKVIKEKLRSVFFSLNT